MNETFLPWWLLLLLGLWALALTIWQNPHAHRELRFWSGVSAIAYLGLFFLAVGAGSRPSESQPAADAASGWMYVELVCIGFSLVAAIWSLGRLSASAKELCYLLFTLANAGICACLQSAELAFGLLIIAAMTAWPLYKKVSRASIHSAINGLRDQFRLIDSSKDARTGDDLLLGLFNVLFTIALIGTLSYALRIETTRPATGPGHTVLPSQDYLKRIHSSSSPAKEQASPIDLALGQRSDLIVLTAVLVFLVLGTTLTDSNRVLVRSKIQDRSQADSDEEPIV